MRQWIALYCDEKDTTILIGIHQQLSILRSLVVVHLKYD